MTLPTLLLCMAALGDEPESAALPDIDRAAGNMLDEIARGPHHRLFTITMAPGQRLDDHATGPRAIVALTPLQLRRRSGGEPLAIAALSAFWLSNTESEGVINVGHEAASYLVLDLPQADTAPAAADWRLCGSEPEPYLLLEPWLQICRVTLPPGGSIELGNAVTILVYARSGTFAPPAVPQGGTARLSTLSHTGDEPVELIVFGIRN